ncbi:MAG: hypothetical protein COA79_00335 [Planctomycetota bacterium]|nr:MAG: hypothetical protein COA79_00335 [Planctomycetota bacterium]
MKTNILISPLLGKIKLPNNTHISESFSSNITFQKNAVTSLSTSNGSYIDATTGEQPNEYLLKRNLPHDKYPMICTEILSSEKIISIFKEVLQDETQLIDSLNWKRNSLNLGNKKILFIYVLLFIIFNILLIFVAKQKLIEYQTPKTKLKQNLNQKTIQKINNEYFIINMNTGKKLKIEKSTTIEEFFNKKD